MRRSAACSSARARVAVSLATRRCSAARRCVMSLRVETTPSGRPPASRTGAEVIETHAWVPSGRVRRAVMGPGRRPVTSASSPRSRPSGSGSSSASSAGARTSSGPRPRSRSRSMPRICSAAALQSVMTPRASRTMRPSAIDWTTDRNRSSLARSASSALVRSAVTAASTSDVSAAVARKSWLESRLSVMDSRTNGPALWAVFQTVSVETTTSAVDAPRGPKRSAAQMSTGKTTYGTSRWEGSSASSTRVVSSAAPSTAFQRENPRSPRVAQVRISGVTTSAPGEVREPPRPPHLGVLVRGDDVPEAQRRGSEAGADQRPHRGRRDQREHVAHALEARPAADQAAQEDRRDDHLERVAQGLAGHRAQRRREVRDQQIADDDAGPQPRPVEHQRRDPHAHRRPQGGHRAVQVGETQPDLCGDVVHARQETDRDAPEQQPSTACGAPGREARVDPDVTVADRAGGHGGSVGHSSSCRTPAGAREGVTAPHPIRVTPAHPSGGEHGLPVAQERGMARCQSTR